MCSVTQFYLPQYRLIAVSTHVVDSEIFPIFFRAIPLLNQTSASLDQSEEHDHRHLLLFQTDLHFQEIAIFITSVPAIPLPIAFFPSKPHAVTKLE